MNKIRIVYHDQLYPEHSQSMYIPFEERDNVCYLKISREFLDDMISVCQQNGLDVCIL